MSKDQKSTLNPGLYIIALPIGNNEDLSPRARSTLSLVDYVLAEDTRVFKEFTSHNQIKIKSIFSHHEHNAKESTKEILDFFKKENICMALVSDAGTPNISDPGHHLIEACYENNISVYGLPGPSSLTLALSLCPIGGKTHFFAGFAPSTSMERKKFFEASSSLADRLVVFEAPHRLLNHLEDAHEYFLEEKVLLLRELTKTHEEILYLPIKSLIAHFRTHKPRGEFVIIYPKIKSPPHTDLITLKNEIQILLQKGTSPKEILDKIKLSSPLKRKALYSLILEVKDMDKTS